MALPSSGILKWSAIQTEFGGSNPVKLSEYYGKDTLPASGLIKASDFYGTSDTITLTSWGTLGNSNWSVNLTSAANNAATNINVIGSGRQLFLQSEPSGGSAWNGTTSGTFIATNIFSALPDITSADAGKVLRGPAVFSVSVGGSANFNAARGSISGPVSSTLTSPTQPGSSTSNVNVAFTISAANNGTLTTASMSAYPASSVTFAETTVSLTLDSDATLFTVS